MKIHPREDMQPFTLHTPRTIPLAWRSDTKTMLDSMVHEDIIQPLGDEVSEWCHPMAVAPKRKGGVCITVDLTKLKKQALRPAHTA